MHLSGVGPRRKDLSELRQYYRYERSDNILNSFGQGQQETMSGVRGCYEQVQRRSNSYFTIRNGPATYFLTDKTEIIPNSQAG